MPRGRLVFAAALACVAMLAIGAPGASGATDVSLNGSLFGSEIQINDATNDDDAITVSLAGGTITIVDNGVGGAVTADTDCTTVSATTITCPFDLPDPALPLLPIASVTSIDLEMNEGTDSFTNLNLDVEVDEDDDGEAGAKTVNSGPGDDEIETGTGDDVVNLGPGNDEAETEEGSDTIRGEEGEDDIEPGEGNDFGEGGPGIDDFDDEDGFPNGADRLDGGPGLDDEVEYDEDEGPDGVTMTIDGVADDGHPGEGDNLTGFEELHGTDRADRIVGSAAEDEIDGHGGNDTLVANGGRDEIEPGLGNDSIDAGPGEDEIAGENGGDRGADADSIEGGPGADFVNYFGQEPVSFTLNGVADDGRAGEGDNVSGVEGAEGGDGADRLVGDGGSNVFFGFDGNDTITGGGGNDALYGGEGDDLLLALGGRDQVECELGFDTAIHDAADFIAGGCERIGAEVTSESAVASKKGKAKVKVSCPAEEGATCKGTVVLLSNGRQIGSGSFSVAAGRAKSATVRLTRQGKRALAASGGSLRVNAEARTTEPQGVSSNADPLEVDALTKKSKKKKHA